MFGVETKCDHCGYHDGWPMFSYNRCRGNCGYSYKAIPLNKEEAEAKLLKALEMVRALPDKKE